MFVRRVRKGSESRRYSAGPRALAVAMAAAIVLGALLMYLREGSYSSLLFYFYLPVAAAAVVLGRRTGVLLALFAIAVAVIPSIWLGLDRVVFGEGVEGERTAVIVIWAVFLVAMAWLVGWVSERGGSLSLTQGLGGRAISAIEKERRRTGQDIHDGIAQYAAAAFIETEVLAGLTAESEPPVRTQVERVKQSLDLLVTEARAMAGSLRPPALGPQEFADSLHQLADSFRARTGVPCDLELEGDFAAHSDSIRICVYRTMQEALSNAERHAEATAVRVWARAGKNGVDLIVRDNGRGFLVEEAYDDDGGLHFGLSGMRERAGYLGGRVVIRSAPGEGTSVVLHVPSYQGKQNGRT